MSNVYRMNAIKKIAEAPASGFMPAATAYIGFYGEDSFNAETMKAYLPKDVCKKLFATIENGETLDPDIAKDVAHAMKKWALDRGATH
ncbi:MAG TPA: glutamine synthetase III, partial [Fibrobacteraceae bacterium]|nr:glutamine synthetase III [Fibrobacteraceae bacterium]